MNDEDKALVRTALQSYISMAKFHSVESPGYGPYRDMMDKATKMQELLDRLDTRRLT